MIILNIKINRCRISRTVRNTSSTYIHALMADPMSSSKRTIFVINTCKLLKNLSFYHVNEKVRFILMKYTFFLIKPLVFDIADNEVYTPYSNLTNFGYHLVHFAIIRY